MCKRMIRDALLTMLFLWGILIVIGTLSYGTLISNNIMFAISWFILGVLTAIFS